MFKKSVPIATGCIVFFVSGNPTSEQIILPYLQEMKGGRSEKKEEGKEGEMNGSKGTRWEGDEGRAREMRGER